MPIRKNLIIGFLNACSLGTGHEELFIAIKRHNVDVLGLNETWLRQGEEGRAPRFHEYRLIHTPRPQQIRSRGGGVGFYIRKSLNFRTLQHPCWSDVEQMWVAIKVRGKSIVIGTGYRPPWFSVDTFFNALYDSVVSFSWADHLIIVGDFNVNYSDSKSLGYRNLNEFLELTKLSQFVNEPTHFTTHNESLLDLVCADISAEQVTVDHISNLSDHSFINVLLSVM
ncbi:unnamed protein product [Colias eurytheme]|nr:unnamed protein product [Colias eurytheme]